MICTEEGSRSTRFQNEAIPLANINNYINNIIIKYGLHG